MNTPRKKLLILASKLGYQTRGFADAAAALGVEVQFATDRCHKLEDPWGDGALPLNFAHPREAAEEIAGQTKSDPPNAILALGDRPTATAAYAAHALGLAGNDPQAVERCRNKLSQRETLRDAGLPVPQFFSFAVTDAVENVLPQVKFPCVVKPLSLATSQGVIRANDEEQFRSAVSRIAALLASPEIQVTREAGLDHLLVESYIPGKEVAIEGLLDRGRLRVLAIFDKPDPLEGPYFEETIYVTPSRLSEDQLAALCDCAARSVAALGLTDGPIHAEFRVNDHGPWALEIAPRPIGGLCSRALRFGPRRISLEELLIRYMLEMGGAEIDREPDASGVMMIPVPRGGIFEGVEGLEGASRVPGVTGIEITARLKDYVAAWPEGASYLGFVFARAAEPAAVESTLRQTHPKLQFRFSARLPVEHPATGKISV
ncbi:MAG: ATP-grasp domain-containing protein [Candidatus Acidiferrales bacterium]